MRSFLSLLSAGPLLPLLLFLVCTVCASGCAEKASVKDQEPASQQDTVRSEDAAIASFIGNAYEGATQRFLQSSYGAVTVTAGREYTSALHLQCREAYIRGGTQTRTAACRDPEQGWIMAPDILGEGRR